MKIRVYKLMEKDKEKKEEIKQIIDKFIDLDEVKAIATYTRKSRRLAGVEVYGKGSKSRKSYINLLENKIIYYERKKEIKTILF